MRRTVAGEGAESPAMNSCSGCAIPGAIMLRVTEAHSAADFMVKGSQLERVVARILAGNLA